MNSMQKQAIGPPLAIAVSCAMWVAIIAVIRSVFR